MLESELSEPDRRALHFIRRYLAEHGKPPTYNEVGQHLKLPHPNNSKRNCDRLVAAGFLSREQMTRDPGRARAIAMAPPLTSLRYPFRGSVSCGSGISPEDLDESIDLQELLRGTENGAVYKARGSSMQEAQIASGDYLIVCEDPDPPVGSLVLAVIGENEETQMVCKKLGLKTDRLMRLDPRNDNFEPIFVPLDLVSVRILGVVKNVFRRY